MKLKRKNLKRMIKDLLHENTRKISDDYPYLENLIDVKKGDIDNLVYDDHILKSLDIIGNLLKGDVKIEDMQEETDLQIVIQEFIAAVHFDIDNASLEAFFETFKDLKDSGVGYAALGTAATGLALSRLPFITLFFFLANLISYGNYSDYKTVVSNMYNLFDNFSFGSFSRVAAAAREEFNSNYGEIVKNFIMLYIVLEDDSSPVDMSIEIKGVEYEIKIHKHSKQSAQIFFKKLIDNLAINTIKTMFSDIPGDISDYLRSGLDVVKDALSDN